MKLTHEARRVTATILCKRPIFSLSAWYRPQTVLEGCRVSWLLAVAGWTSCLVASYYPNKNIILRRMALLNMTKMQMVVELTALSSHTDCRNEIGRKKTKVCCIFLGESPASEFDGVSSRRVWRWNRVFRNVGTWNSGAGEWSEGKNTTFRTRRKL